ncbi:MAG: FAD-dependent oxidoreductase [Oligoflexia bacterium]|nr:FAD-dependent oxidoreductase [Oligoflexia bacterium]
MKILVVGGVAGGAAFAARMRRLNERAQIIIFERGEYVSFANCGLPYHISDKIPTREDLLLKTPEDFIVNYNIEVRLQHEVIAIDKTNKSIKVKNLLTHEIITEHYDYLLLSPGAKAYIPPMEGHSSDLVFTLKTIPDMDQIIAHMKRHAPTKALVIGGGFIGLEVIENLVEKNIDTHLVEFASQVLPPLDPEMAAILQSELLKQKVSIYLNDSVRSIKKINAKESEVVLSSGKTLITHMIVCAVGVRPESELAASAGLQLSEKQAICVNENMQTSDPYIYAIGDAIEVTHLIAKNRTLLPLASPAAKAARIAANHIAGLPTRPLRVQGTAIVKLFSQTAALTGLSEKSAKALKLPYQSLVIHPFHHVLYYPGAKQLTLKILFHKESGEILGAQAVGEEGVDKRIDVLATAIRGGMTIYELEELELCYAPPYGASKDPINMLGFVAQNQKDQLTQSITCDEIATITNPFFLDVRTPAEFNQGHLTSAINIPLYALRARLNEVPLDKTIIVNCAVGIRAYNAIRILKGNNYPNVINLTGGYKSYLQFKKKE